MRIIAHLPVDSILPMIPDSGQGSVKPRGKKGRKPIVVNGTYYFVRLGDTIFRLFKQNLSCVGCGIIGNVFELKTPTKVGLHRPIRNCFIDDCAWCGRVNERQILRAKFQNSAFLNLYHINAKGQKILMTKDHIKPLSRGGSNTLSNLQVMCTHCNNKKGSKYEMHINP